MSIQVKNSSRLFFADLKFIDGVEFWDMLILPPNRPRAGDVSYTVRSGDRIDLLANLFYQDPILWWVLAWANDLEILPTDLKEGQILVVPSIEFVQREMLSKAGKGI